VFDIGQGAGAHFIVMEYVDGADLKAVLEYLETRRELMPVEVACLIAQHICEGLAYAHAARDHNGQPLNIVHRDISPHNVLITRYGEVKLVDFGLAKASSHLTEDDEDLVKGKFGYLAPEVTLGQPSDHRVDIFAAGILLWEMLTGRRLFRGESDVETFKLVRATEIPDPRQFRSDVPEELFSVLMKALARDPDERYRAADDLARDLSVVLMLSGRPVTYQDVARFVAATAEARDRRKQSSRKVDSGMMGDLIIGALHDFSGGTTDFQGDTGDSRLGTRGIAAGEANEGFVDPSAWGLDALFDEPASASPAPVASPTPVASHPTLVSAQPPAVARPAPSTAQPSTSQPAAAADRARPTERPAKRAGPFWQRWFG
jgi:serine/threonine-protein kinase